MLRNRFAAVLAIAAFAGVLVTAGCASAATKPPAAAATASARAVAATGGTANIMIYGVNTDGAYWQAWTRGQSLGGSRAVEYALQDAPPDPTRPEGLPRAGDTGAIS